MKAETEKQRPGSEQGFTLVEMLVSISIMTVVMSAIFTFLWGASSYWQSGQSTADVTENARLGLNRMTRELMQGSVLTTASANQVVFNVDFGSGNETVTYGFEPGTGGESGYISRSSSSGSQPVALINEVEAVRFDYYGNDYRCDLDNNGVVFYTELQACATYPLTQISRVDILLTMRAGSAAKQTFVGQAWLRNRSTT